MPIKPSAAALRTLFIVLPLITYSGVCFGSSSGEGQCTPDQALEKLQIGNQHFVDGNLGVCKETTAVLREKLAKGQSPYAIVLSCSDSRVPPELVFDKAPGDLFVVRVAGNTVDPIILASIEYAVVHLGAPLIVVLGHERCGAVTAAVDSISPQSSSGGHEHGEEVSSEESRSQHRSSGKKQKAPIDNIKMLIDRILPAVKKAKQASPKADRAALVELSADENIKLVSENITRQSTVLRKYVDEGKVKIIPAKYDLDDGKVKVMGKQKCTWVSE